MLDEPLWTVRSAAEFLSVSEATVRAWQHAHLVPFIKIGGSIRFVPDELRRWVADSSVTHRAVAGAPDPRQVMSTLWS
jgi:excisionase family DNA binding protein